MNKELELILITNQSHVAGVAETAGVDIVMVDLEQLGKKERQGHLNTVISDHDIDDVRKLRKTLRHARLMVRVNPMNPSSEMEINKVIDLGADLVMLPMFKTKIEVSEFIRLVDGRAKTVLLLETPEALCRLDSILEVDGIDVIHIGLNDLHLGLKLEFMFEPLAGGLVEYMTQKFSTRGIKYGFGGIAKIGQGMLPAEYIIREHARLGSTLAILSRTLHEAMDFHHSEIARQLQYHVDLIKGEYRSFLMANDAENKENKKIVRLLVERIVSGVSQNITIQMEEKCNVPTVREKSVGYSERSWRNSCIFPPSYSDSNTN